MIKGKRTPFIPSRTTPVNFADSYFSESPGVMADDSGADTKKKRGRPAKSPAAEVVEKPKAEKRGRPAAKEDKGDSDGAPASKRGRGRPKGSAKRKAKGKAKSASSGGGSGRGRGRPAKKAAAAEEKDQSSGADEGEEGDD
ncbi:unnamed protein product [Allacma fusca]|uniref:Uncharacterized protein n=1 Tax=Allacma fusca TaxID=39272 RepID=A0A8J2MDS7_9HEXA|nr:unnamed protein product [Allacma fusca]